MFQKGGGQEQVSGVFPPTSQKEKIFEVVAAAAELAAEAQLAKVRWACVVGGGEEEEEQVKVAQGHPPKTVC